MRLETAIRLDLWDATAKATDMAGAYPLIEVVFADGTTGVGGPLGRSPARAELAAVADALARARRRHGTLRSALGEPLISGVWPSFRLAIEIACMDASAKRLGRPLWDLLGGRGRPAVPLLARADLPRDREFVDRLLDAEGDDRAFAGLLIGLDEDSAERDLRALLGRRRGTDRLSTVAIDLGSRFARSGVERLAPTICELSPSLAIDPGRGLEESLAIGRHDRLGVPVAVGRGVEGCRDLGRALTLQGAAAVAIDPVRWGGLREVADALALCRAFSIRALLLAPAASPTRNALWHLCLTDPWATSSLALMARHFDEPIAAPGELSVIEARPGHGYALDRSSDVTLVDSIEVGAAA